MEIAKFVLTAIGTFLSVFGLSFTIFQNWKKKQDEKIEQLNVGLGKKIQAESDSRREAINRLHERVDKLDGSIMSFTQLFENRLSKIEGKLDGMCKTLDKIQDWFINNPPRGK
jgi:prefoldin subunit 5